MSVPPSARLPCSLESPVPVLHQPFDPFFLTKVPASKELVDQFNDLLSDSSHFGLIVTISSESLQPRKLLTPAKSSFTDSLSLLSPHITPDEALYILLRRYDSTPRLVAVTYVPDAAPVRQKMLFASTRLTLVRELGSEHFRETIFVTTAEELSPKGFEKHDKHTALEAPLTEEERSLGEVKRAEQEAGSGTGIREIHLSQSLKMPVGQDAIAAMKDVGQEGGHVLAMLVSTSHSRVKDPYQTDILLEDQPGE